MNWILRKSNKFDYHTDLSAVLYPLMDDIQNLKWLLSDLEYTSSAKKNLPINMDDEYIVLLPHEFLQLVQVRMQVIWGVLIGIPVNCIIDIGNIPYADGNSLVWENDNFQHPDARIEIICFDSGYTIFKFKYHLLSKKFKAYFPEAVELEKFKNKSAPYY